MKQIAIRFIFLILVLLSCFGIGEIAAKAYYYLNPHWRDDPGSKYLIPNNSFSHWHPENFAGRSASESGEFDVTFHTNSFGMVDRERTLEKRGAVRIGLLGDSFVEGVQVEMHERFSDLLEKALSSETAKVEVLNFGCSWFSPLLERALYNHLAVHFRPDLVLVFVHFTDVTDNWTFRQQAVFDQLGGLERVRANSYLTSVRSPEADWLRESSLIRLVYRGWQAYGALTNVRGPSLKENFGAWFKLKLNEDDRLALRFSESNIAALVKSIRGSGSEVLLVGIPISQTITGSAKNRFVRQRLTSEQIHGARQYYTWLQNLSGSLEVEYVDLLDAFIRSADRDRLFFPVDGHFTRYGHQVVASVLQDILH